MHVRTDMRAGQGAVIDPQQLSQLLQTAQNVVGQPDPAQLAALAGGFGLQVDPQQLASLTQLAGGATGPQQFLAMVGTAQDYLGG